MLRAAWGSTARIAVAPLQDFLNAPPSARINTPSTLGGNWVFRTAKTDYTPSEEEITAIYDKIVELKLWTMPNDVRSDIELIQPMTYMEIRFTMNGKTYEILADTTVFRGAGKYIDTKNAETVGEFCMFMQQFMMDTDEYQSLPESRGGYQ